MAERVFLRSTAACVSGCWGSNPYLSAIIEQDEAPVIIADYGGFFVSGVLFVALFGYNLPTA
jgi:hypothetical protein